MVILATRTQLIKAAGIAGIAEGGSVMITQGVVERTEDMKMVVEHISGDSRTRHLVDHLGNVTKLTEDPR